MKELKNIKNLLTNEEYEYYLNLLINNQNEKASVFIENTVGISSNSNTVYDTVVRILRTSNSIIYEKTKKFMNRAFF